MIGWLDTPAKNARCRAFEEAQKRAHEAVRKAGLKRTGVCQHASLSPCEGDTCWHHSDYTAVLDVVELCRRHHDAAHRALGWGYSRDDAGDSLDGWQHPNCRWPEPPGTPTLAECMPSWRAEVSAADKGCGPLDPLVGSFDFHDPQVAAESSVESATSTALSPWLARRRLAFGASEIAPLLVALGRVTPAEVAALPKYLREQASSIFKRKAFPRKERSAGSAASRGQQAERPVFEVWANDNGCRVRSSLVSVSHADAAPRSWFPLVDRLEPHSSATPDGWGSDLFGDDVGVEVKTTVEVCGPRLPWWWVKQIHQQNGVCGYAWTALVIGEGWAHWNESQRRHPRAVRVERDEAEIERIRAACRDGWARVEEMRADKRKAA